MTGHIDLESFNEYVHSNEDFATSGAIGGSLQRLIPIYGLVNSYKKANALRKAGDNRYQVITPGERVGRKLIADALTVGSFITPYCSIGFVPSVTENGVTSSRFQDLVNNITNLYMKKHPNDDRAVYRKLIKDSLYSGKDKYGILSDIGITNIPKPKK